MKKLLALTLTVFFLLFLSSSAYALPWIMNQLNSFKDSSVERFIDENDSGTFDNGDRLRGIFNIDELVTAGSTLEPGTLTGIFDITVTQKSDTSTGELTETWSNSFGENFHGVNDGDSFTTDLYSYNFGPSTEFEDTYGTDAMVAFFIDNDNPIYQDNEIAPDTAEGNVTDGNLYWTFGLGNTGEWKVGAAPENIDIFKYVRSAETVASTNIGLNLLDNQAGPPLLQQLGFDNSDNDLVLVDLFAKLDLKGIGNIDTQFDVKNTLDAEIYPTPEPTTLLLFGTGLLGLAAFGRKKFMRKS